MRSILLGDIKLGRNYPFINHVIFWLSLLAFLLIFDRADEPATFVFFKEIINISFFIPLVYFNLNYLIPSFLEKGKFLQYFLISITLILLLTPIKTVVSFLIHYQYPEQQAYLLSHQYLIGFQLLFVLLASLEFSLVSSIFRHQLEKKELQEQNLTSELKFLKSQIDPHFFFNTLNSLYALTLKKSDSAPETVLKLSEIMRYMLYECNEKTVPLEKEIQYINNYIDLERIRHGKDARIVLDITGDYTNKEIMPLVFSPFIENSFKHGLQGNIDDRFIEIKLDIQESQLYFNVKNSKSDLRLPTVPLYENDSKAGGIGLSNVQRRLKLEYPNDHSLRIIDKEDIYSIELDLKLKI